MAVSKFYERQGRTAYRAMFVQWADLAQDFGEHYYQCVMPFPGVPFHPDPMGESGSGLGPCSPQVIVATAIKQGPETIFIRCKTGSGWLPLTDPTVMRNQKPKGGIFEVQGATLWFKHLGTRQTVRREYPSLMQSLYRPPANHAAALASVQAARKAERDAKIEQVKQAKQKVPKLQLNMLGAPSLAAMSDEDKTKTLEGLPSEHKAGIVEALTAEQKVAALESLTAAEQEAALNAALDTGAQKQGCARTQDERKAALESRPSGVKAAAVGSMSAEQKAVVMGSMPLEHKAAVLESMGCEQQAELLRKLPLDQKLEALERMSAEQAVAVLGKEHACALADKSQEEKAAVLEGLSCDQQAAMVQTLPQQQKAAMMDALEPSEQARALDKMTLEQQPAVGTLSGAGQAAVDVTSAEQSLSTIDSGSSEEGLDGLPAELRAAVLENMPAEAKTADVGSMSTEQRVAILAAMTPTQKACVVDRMTPELKAAALSKMPLDQKMRAVDGLPAAQKAAVLSAQPPPRPLSKREQRIASERELMTPRDVNPEKEMWVTMAGAAVANLVAQNFALLAIDFDQTLVSVHTGSYCKMKPSVLAKKVRRFFPELLSQALAAGLHVVVCTNSKQVELIREALNISIPEVNLEAVMIGLSAEHGLPRGSPGKQDHLRSALEWFEIESMVQACLLDDTEENLTLARAEGAAAVQCPIKVGDEVAGKAVLQGCAEAVACDPEQFALDASDPQCLDEIPSIVPPERKQRSFSQHDPLPSLGTRLRPRPNQIGYRPPSPRTAVVLKDNTNGVPETVPVCEHDTSSDPTEAAEVIDATNTDTDTTLRNARLRQLQQRLATQPRILTKAERIALEHRVAEAQRIEAENRPQPATKDETPVSVGVVFQGMKDEMNFALSRSPRGSPQSTPQSSRHPSPTPSPRGELSEGERINAEKLEEVCLEVSGMPME